MARKWFCGFEAGDASECGGSSGGGTTIVTTTKRSGGYALQCPSGTGAYRESKTGFNLSTIYVRTYLYATQNPGARCWVLNGGTSADVDIDSKLFVETDGRLGVDNGGGTTNSTEKIKLNVWNCIEYKLVISATVGAITVRLNDVQVINATGKNTGTSNVDRIAFGSLTGAWGANIFHDDLAVDDAAFPGNGFVIARQGKAGTPTYDAWSKNGAATAALCLSDTPVSSATTCTSTTSGAAQTMNVAAFSATQTGHGSEVVHPLDTVVAVKAAINAKDAVGVTAKIRRRVNGTDTDTNAVLTTASAYFDDGIWTTTVANLDLLEVGIVHAADANQETINDAWVIAEIADAPLPQAIL